MVFDIVSNSNSKNIIITTNCSQINNKFKYFFLMIYYYRINIETQKGQIKGCQILKYLKVNTNE